MISESDVLQYKNLLSGYYITTSTTEQTRYTSVKMYFNNSHRMVIDQQQMNTHSHPKKTYMEPTFQAPFCLLLSNIRQSKKPFVSPLRNVRLDQPIPSCGRLLVEHQSRSSPLGYFSMAFPTLFPTGAADLQPSHLYHYNYSVIPLHFIVCYILFIFTTTIQSYPNTLHCASSALAQARPTMPCIH